MITQGLGYAPAAVASPAQMPKATRRVWWDAYVPPAFITLILLVAHYYFGILEHGPWRTLAAIGTAMLVEVILGLLVVGRIPHLASAYITGISVGILVRNDSLFWPFPLCAAVSIVSKYALRVGGRHLWNPSNFGVSALLFLAPMYYTGLSSQWGSNLAPIVIIWTLGFIITWRVRRFHMSLTYALSFVFFAYIRHLLNGQNFVTELAPITGPMYMLFTFFMVTDPKTTVKPKWAQYLFVFMVAAVECVLRMNEAIKAPYYALFIVGPIANLLEITLTRKKPHSA
jgi:Na+-translocating ferredoxin:NAD+ oxidoreductase RnfD subunit